MVDIEKLVGNPRNPNKHPLNQIEQQAKIINAQGWRNPIVISKRSGFVVKGHGRLAAARLLGLKAIYCKRNTSKPHPKHEKAPYLLKDMQIDKPDMVWATDIT